LGVYGRENVSSTKTLLTEKKKTCSKHAFGTWFEKFCEKADKWKGPNKSGGLEKFSKTK